MNKTFSKSNYETNVHKDSYIWRTKKDSDKLPWNVENALFTVLIKPLTARK